MTWRLRSGIVLGAAALGVCLGAAARWPKSVGGPTPGDRHDAPASRPPKTPDPAVAERIPGDIVRTATPVPPADPAASRTALDELLARLRSARESGDTLMAADLLVPFAMLGEPGFSVALELLEDLHREFTESDLENADGEVGTLLRNPALAPFLEWLLSDGRRGWPGLRLQAAIAWIYLPDVDPVPLAMRLCREEQDGDVLRALGLAIGSARPEHVETVEATIRTRLDNPDQAAEMIHLLARSCRQAAWDALARLAAERHPRIAEAARVEMRMVRPSSPGPAVVWTAADSAVPLRRGDIIQSVNGRTVATIADCYALLDEWSGGQEVDLVVDRDGELARIRIEAGAKTFRLRMPYGRSATAR